MESYIPSKGRRHSSVDAVALENMTRRRVSIDPSLHEIGENKRLMGRAARRVSMGPSTHEIGVNTHSMGESPRRRRHSVMNPTNLSSRRRSSRFFSLQALGPTSFTGLPLAPAPQPTVENTYKLGPDEDKRYHEHVVRQATERMVDEVLEGTSYMKSEYPKEKEILNRHLNIWGEMVEGPTEGGRLAKILVSEVKDELKTLNMDRYKFVVNAVAGDCRGQGLLVASKCLWDTETDGHITVRRQTENHFAVVMVHTVYFE